ncbi:phosphoglycerate mutase-like protein [Phanerochaete sordida]|uniref:Phosphoglycerate mutase-like protein n=1 Tax=Phanerochaete sordida TaxID=48140 RepID=A0A9P3GNP8_9APHY|nr:phosphoglycerate mutase-like protein [Phanerochaete sordida]
MIAVTSLLVVACSVASILAAFNPLHHSGPASPYFIAPHEDNLPQGTPDGCVVDQAAYIVRHGSRYPEPGSFTGWQMLFEKFQNATFTASGPLSFIPTWSPPVDDIPHEPLFLTSTGALEAFRLGVELRKAYRFTPGGSNFTVWSAGQQRVVDTATFFLRGYLSQGNYLGSPDQNRGFVVVMPDSVNFTFADSLTSSNGCPAYNAGSNGTAQSNAFRATFQQRVADRLNRFLDGLTLDPTDIGVMQDLCGFQAEVNGDTRFCNVFEDSEWLDYEYAHDLNYYYGAGPGNPFGATVGFGWVQAVTDLLVAGPNVTLPNATFTPPPLTMSYTHDNNLPDIVAALGLWNTSDVPGVYPLPNDHIPAAHRDFRASHLVSFHGHVALERLSCGQPLAHSVKHKAGQLVVLPGAGNDTEKFVRVRINHAVVPLPNCTSGPGLSCPLASFAHFINTDRAAAAGDFIEVCGLQNVSNATGSVDFFTRVPSENAQSVVLEVPVQGFV